MTETAVTSIEAPSGKDVAYENFPVGSWLLPARLRPHVAVFYAYARAIDDIADDPKLPSEEKIARLTGFEAALLGRGQGEGFAKAHAMRTTLAATGISVRHCLDLISAFKQDAAQRRYRSWDDLIDYCNRSAAPVGRFLVDLHGGGRNGYTAADALCNALQVINHLQDCQEDYRLLNRVYLPCDWLAEAGAAVEDLDLPRTTPALRRVIDRMLDSTDVLLATAQRLPGELKSRRLGMESSAILAIARLLVQRLRAGDPLAGRVALSKAEYAWCCVRGAGAALG
ncbi:MAG: squalene synthase HpnC [Defluviicoccus sp.]